MLDYSKTNRELGEQIHQVMLKNDVETPMLKKQADLDYSSKKELIRSLFKDIMLVLGLDLEDDSLHGTPERISKMFLNEIYWGLDYNNFPKITTIENKMKVDEMVCVSDIKINSNCEHHFVPIIGTATIAYIPSHKVIGLSKFNRVVEFFSRRPQVQERLTEQIFWALCYLLETENVAVLVEGVHTCVITRGVEDYNSSTTTSKLGGVFKTDPTVRTEFFNIRNKKLRNF